MSAAQNPRQNLVNLGITVGVVLAVLVLAALFRHKPSGTRLREISPVKTTPPTPPVTPGTPTAPAHTPTQHFEQFPSAKLITATTNEADTLRVNIGTEEQLFTLYFADALECNFSSTQRVHEQSIFFGKATPEAIIETGRQALQTVTAALSAKPFRLLTRWERTPGTAGYLALILVQNESGQWTYLADQLIRQGLARVSGITTPIPDEHRPLEDYLIQLRDHAKFAREHRLGIWARVVHPEVTQ